MKTYKSNDLFFESDHLMRKIEPSDYHSLHTAATSKADNESIITDEGMEIPQTVIYELIYLNGMCESIECCGQYSLFHPYKDIELILLAATQKLECPSCNVELLEFDTGTSLDYNNPWKNIKRGQDELQILKLTPIYILDNCTDNKKIMKSFELHSSKLDYIGCQRLLQRYIIAPQSQDDASQAVGLAELIIDWIIDRDDIDVIEYALEVIRPNIIENNFCQSFRISFFVFKCINKNQVAVLEKLLEAKAPPNGHPDAYTSPLHRCIAKNNKEMIELLIKFEADINYIDRLDKTPISLATEMGLESSFIDFLIEHKAELTEECKVNEHALLHYAIKSKDTSNLEPLPLHRSDHSSTITRRIKNRLRKILWCWG